MPGNFPAITNAFIIALAAGRLMLMVAGTMTPEAFEEAQSYLGLITAAELPSFALPMKTGR